MSETGSDTRSGIGARLRAGREKTGLTVLQAAEKLHLDAKVVESLEAERFDALGAPVFVRGHLKHYAELIGEQSGQLLELYVGATKPVQPDLTRLPKIAPESSSPSRLAVPALVVLIGFVLLGVVWWVVKSVRTPSQSEPKSAQPVTIEPEASGEPRSVPEALVTPPVVPAPPPKPVAAATTPSAAPAAANAAAAVAAAPARGKALQVTLRFAADSWVEIYDANGEKLFYDIGSAGSSHAISGTPPFRVTFANAPGVTLDVNGKPVEVPASAVKDEAAQFVINRSGRIVKARAPAGGG